MEEKNITKKLPTRDKIPLEVPEEINQIENNELIEEIHGKIVSLEEQISLSNEVLLKNIDSLNTFYAGFSAKTDEVINHLNKEVLYTRSLESQIAQKKSEFESLELKKALEDDRAKFSLSLDQMEKDLKEGLQRIDNFTNQSFEGIKSQITSFDSRIDELNKIDDTITNCIEKYRKDMTDSSTREFQILKGESENLLKESKIKIEALTKEVIDFLKSCQKQNQELIKKIPKQSNKVCLKDVLIYILTGTSFIGMITQMIMLFSNK